MSKVYKKIICYKCKKDTWYTEEIIVKGNIKEDMKCQAPKSCTTHK